MAIRDEVAPVDAAGAGLSAHGRLGWLDVARGAALLAMAIYHFTFDLAMFGLIDPATPVTTPWREFARAIAGTFLALVGVGLVIGHGRGVRWRPFWRRFALIAGAAGLITAGTLVAARVTGLPDLLIHFGILHMIAAGSLAGLALVRAPWWLALLVAALVLAVGLWWTSPSWTSPLLDRPALWWLGLSAWRPPSVDFVPFFPAFAAVALGIAAAKLAGLDAARGPIHEAERPALARVPARAPSRALAWAGRHSLLVYLAHQPILIGLLWLALALTGLVPPPF